MGIEEAIAFIHHTEWIGSKLGLTRMKELMHRLGDPQKHLRFIHVAGTNGKGSVCAMLASILTKSGYKTGMYTSPHLVRINERIIIDGLEITDEEICRIAEQTKRAVDEMNEHPTEFEIITAMALLYFHHSHCDIVVLEVGLGGRLDATNVIGCPDVAVIMNIGLEHTQVLGDTVEKIAVEKAGIIKEHGVVVAYQSVPSVLGVLKTICDNRNAVLNIVNFDSIVIRTQSLAGQQFDFDHYDNLRLSLLGPHQVRNAAVVLTIVDCLIKQGWNIGDNATRSGLAGVKWPARFEVLSRTPLFILDGAHNPQCVDTLVDGLRQLLPDIQYVFLLGVLADKDYPAMLQKIVPFARLAVCLTPASSRALPAEKLAESLRESGVEAMVCRDAAGGVAAALKAAEGVPVIAFGSLYLAGQIREVFPSVCHAEISKVQTVVS